MHLFVFITVFLQFCQVSSLFEFLTIKQGTKLPLLSVGAAQ